MKKNILLLTICFCMTFANMNAQNPVQIALWPDGIPESNGITEPESTVDGRISNISVPDMTVYPADPSKNTNAAILICPGGGYAVQSSVHEGSQFAQWLSENGITGIVLKYRLPNHHAFVPLKDAQQAIRIIRSRASEWNIDPNKIGISGFSAGGHLASTAGTHFDLGSPVSDTEKGSSKNKKKAATHVAPTSSYSCRPDFMILFYPVITMQEGLTHQGTRTNLLGDKQDKDSVDYYSNEMQVTKDTPPTLIFLSDDDNGVSPKNSTDFYAALKKNGVPASLYIFPEGGHGWGFNDTFSYHKIWKTLYIEWLKQQKFI